jgi:hypothetical protein
VGGLTQRASGARAGRWHGIRIGELREEGEGLQRRAAPWFESAAARSTARRSVFLLVKNEAARCLDTRTLLWFIRLVIDGEGVAYPF